VIRGAGLAVDGDTIEIGDTLFSVCPWWDGPHARDGVERMLDDAAQRRRGRWIWVYHAPPESALSWNGTRHFGDATLAALIARHAPTAVLCGHIHEAPFRRGGSWIDRAGDTWLFNAGRQIGDVPARIEIDFAQGHARWISLAGIEERSLQ
jgi:Icc-related predicted phosphoesterase